MKQKNKRIITRDEDVILRPSAQDSAYPRSAIRHKSTMKYLVISIVILFSSCSSYKILSTQELMESSNDRYLNPIDYKSENLDHHGNDQRLINTLKERYGAKYVSIGEQYLVSNSNNEYQGSWIQITIKDSPRITNIGSIGYSEPFAEEIAIAVKPNILNWSSYRVVEVHLETSEKGYRKYFFNTKNMSVIRIEDINELSSIIE